MGKKIYKEEFDELTFDEKINSLHRYGVYLMSRKVHGYYINLYGLFGTYVEVWYTESNDEVCRIEIVNDDSILDLYLERITLKIF